MADPRFFKVSGPFSLADLAEISKSALADKADPDKKFYDVAALERATAGDVSFLDGKIFLEKFKASQAGACVCSAEFAEEVPDGMDLLINENPYRAYALIAQAFYPQSVPAESIHEKSVIDDSAKIGTGCHIEAGAVIGAAAEIGDYCHIGPNAVIGEGVILGAHTMVGSNASLSHCIVGSHVAIYPGVQIGQDGFGFVMSPQGHLKVPQLGRVIIEDDVEIGANATIDRGASDDTVIGAGSRIDNLVQIAHNVKVGRHSVLVAQVGIAGSTKLGDFVAIGGQAGLSEHLDIGPGARIAAQSGVMRNVGAQETVMGSPAIPSKEFMRQTAVLGKMARKKKKS